MHQEEYFQPTRGQPAFQVGLLFLWYQRVAKGKVDVDLLSRIRRMLRPNCKWLVRWEEVLVPGKNSHRYKVPGSLRTEPGSSETHLKSKLEIERVK